MSPGQAAIAAYPFARGQDYSQLGERLTGEQSPLAQGRGSKSFHQCFLAAIAGEGAYDIPAGWA